MTVNLKRILSGKHKRDERFFLETSVNDQKVFHLALNEAVIHSGGLAKLMEYDLFLDNKFAFKQKADGIIISTPTGSTAYSLSANGSIVHPAVKAINIVPMFPHSLNSRPLLVSNYTKIIIKVAKGYKAKLSLDSHHNINLKDGDEVLIKKANSYLFKSLGHQKYFSLCRHSDLMIGNSSSGIVEAASFKLPVINIGTRQNGKVHPINVIKLVNEWFNNKL